jgi:hypothetical protein
MLYMPLENFPDVFTVGYFARDPGIYRQTGFEKNNKIDMLHIPLENFPGVFTVGYFARDPGRPCRRWNS